MNRTVWRIATDTPSYQAHDLSGAGAKKTGGRWNEIGTSIVYSSATRALACLETVVHLNAGGLPLNRYLVEITIPDAVWGNAQVENSGSLLVGWDAEPAGQVSIRFGTAWASALTGTAPLSLMKTDPADAQLLVIGWLGGTTTSGSGSRRPPGCIAQFLCSARGPFLRPGLRFRPRRAQRRSREERSNPQPRAARSFARAWRGLRAPDLDRREHDATLVVGRDLDSDQALVVRRFGLAGSGSVGSGLRREGPSMRMVTQ